MLLKNIRAPGASQASFCTPNSYADASRRSRLKAWFKQSKRLVSEQAGRNANAGNAMECPLNAGAVIQRKYAHTMNYVVDVFARDGQLAEIDSSTWKAPFGRAAEVKYDLDQVLQICLAVQRVANVRRHHAQK